MLFNFTGNIYEISDDVLPHPDPNALRILHLLLYDNAFHHDTLFGVSKARDKNYLLFYGLNDARTSLIDTSANHIYLQRDFDGNKLDVYYVGNSLLHNLLHLFSTQFQNYLLRSRYMQQFQGHLNELYRLENSQETLSEFNDSFTFSLRKCI